MIGWEEIQGKRGRVTKEQVSSKRYSKGEESMEGPKRLGGSHNLLTLDFSQVP